MAQINPGYMGWADLGGRPIRFTDANIAAQQDVNAPDLIMGHWDRNAWVAGPITIGGSMSGPVTENFAAGVDSVWGKATRREAPCGELTRFPMTLNYYCGDGGGTAPRNSRTFEEMMIQSLNISCSAGDVAQYSIEFIGAKEPSWGGYGGTYNEEEKLLTWDVVGISGGIDALVSSFDITIANNIEAMYAINGTERNYYPETLVPGLRHISGTITYYNIPQDVSDAINYGTAHSNRGTISFSLGDGFTGNFNCAFHRVAPTSSIGALMSTVAFTGVGPQAALDA
jgi:hypothetical protein